MGDLDITITPGLVEIVVNMYVDKTDVIELLQFDEGDIERLLKVQASLQARWEAVAIEINKSKEDFETGFRKRWWAHHKQFSKLILAAQGDLKPTVDSVKDSVILVFSSDTTSNALAYYGQMAHGVAVKKKTLYTSDYGLDYFLNDMCKYINAGWYFENIEGHFQRLQTDYDHVRNVADKLNSRSYNLNALKELVKPKLGNV